MPTDPRRIGLLGLLALVPVVLFALGRSTLALVAVLCVVVIAWSLYRLFEPERAVAG